MKNLLILSFLLLAPKIKSWYSRCDASGRCYIGNTPESVNIYLTPGYVPIIEGSTVIPLPDTNQTKVFDIQAIAGYSLYGPLKNSKKGYECTGGLSECANSYCNEGKCAEAKNVLKDRRNKVKLIIIITVFVFVGIILVYWGVFFILGFKYNKQLQSQGEYKTDQGYGDVVGQKKDGNQNNGQNPNREINEVDNSNIKSQGTENNDEEEQKKSDDEEEKKRQDIGAIADFMQNQNEGDESNEQKVDI